MMDDFRLMIEKKFAPSAIINHKSKMLPSSIQTRQEMLAKLARKVWDMPDGKATSSSIEQSDTSGRETAR